LLEINLSYHSKKKKKKISDMKLPMLDAQVIVGPVVQYAGGFQTEGDVVAKSFHQYSDRRLKDNIKPLESSPSIIQGLANATASYNLKGEPDKTRNGFIAQGVEATNPFLVEKKSNGLSTIDPIGITAHLTKGLANTMTNQDLLEKRVIQVGTKTNHQKKKKNLSSVLFFFFFPFAEQSASFGIFCKDCKQRLCSLQAAVLHTHSDGKSKQLVSIQRLCEEKSVPDIAVRIVKNPKRPEFHFPTHYALCPICSKDDEDDEELDPIGDISENFDCKLFFVFVGFSNFFRQRDWYSTQREFLLEKDQMT
jgi:hypothetical protein